MGAAIRRLVAGFARAVRQMEDRAQALHPLGQGRGVGKGLRFAHRRSRQPISDARYHACARPPAGGLRKRGAKTEALGRSRGGLTTKIHTLTDAQGRPLRFILTAGQAHDCTTAADLLADRATTGVIADKAYDTNELRELI